MAGPDPRSPDRGVVPFLRRSFNRLAARWATPGAGRVALCSPLVGVVAGLGATAFLLLLGLMYKYVLGGLMHLRMPRRL